MVSAKLHIICGNCGIGSHMMSHQIKTEEVHGPRDVSVFVSIYCHNCGTIHRLEDTVKKIDT